MNAEHWRRVEALFHLCVRLPEPIRSGLLDDVCVGQPDVRADVDAVLAASAHADGFIEHIVRLALDGVQDGRESLAPGTGARHATRRMQRGATTERQRRPSVRVPRTTGDVMTTQLRCGDLMPGDILLKVSDGSLLSGAIQFGQAFVGGLNTSIVHAGILFDATYIIEAQGSGISANDLRVQNLAYAYYVFRCAEPHMGAGAGTCAKMMFDIHGQGRNLGYSVIGAIGSLLGSPGRAATRTEMDRLLDRILEGRDQRFFCSQFVVFVYQFVAEQCGVAATSLFDTSDAKASPSTLATSLNRHRLFAEVGYLMPGQR
jgi:hypothetical protein